MCGVIGLVTWQKKPSFDPEKTCINMTHALAHRGNDGEGFYTSSNQKCFLGHRRLSILDTSNAGQQPMSTPDTRYTIAYNGEIYNYLELKKTLIGLGITFKSTSDTEILLHGYAAWGKDVFKKLRGMFAGCIWDNEKKEFILFRDQIGIKPLYWWHDNGNSACSSEIQALRKHALIASEVNGAAVNEYFISGSIHAPTTIFKNIYALKPGHIITITENTFVEEQYWNINTYHTNNEKISINEVQENILHLLRDSIAHHVISDIPLGAFLSGGLDSSCIVALMKEQKTERFDTFSIGFDSVGKTIDESKEAAAIAQYFGTNHHHILTTHKTFVKNFDAFIEYLDQPSTDGFNSFLVSQATAQHVHVALSGLGGDELFLGYRYHQELARFLPLKEHFFSPALSFASHTLNTSPLLKKILYHSSWRGFEKLAHASSPQGYLNARSLLFPRTLFSSEYEINRWYSKHAIDLLEETFQNEPDILNAYSKAELLWYTPGTLLRDADVTGMAFTLEVRFPFLDLPLIEQMLTLPSNFKIQSHQPPKALLRSILAKFMPESLLMQTKKGFEMPIGHWLIQYPHLYKSLEQSKLFKTNGIKQQINKLEKNPADYLMMWQALIFTHWLEKNNLIYG